MKTSRILSIAFVVALAAVGVVAMAATNSPDAYTFLAHFGADPAAAMLFSAVGMTTFTEGNHAGEHLISEGEGTISRDVITVASTYDLVAGTVLGKIRGTASSAALGTNTGNGVMGAVTLGAGALEGAYKLAIIEPATNLGNFLVEDPNGSIVGHGTVGSAFSMGGLSFTLADGATDFVSGDSFTITVAAGTKYGPFDPAATDGREAAVAVLFDDCDATSADTSAVVHSRYCEVASSKLTWAATASSPQKAAALAQLKVAGIVAR